MGKGNGKAEEKSRGCGSGRSVDGWCKATVGNNKLLPPIEVHQRTGREGREREERERKVHSITIKTEFFV